MVIHVEHRVVEVARWDVAKGTRCRGLQGLQKGAPSMLIRRLRHLSVVALVAVVALAGGFSAGLRAQNISSSELHGTVHDSSGAVIPNGAITIADASKGFTRSTISDGQGEYRLLLLPP